jgi:hypothetical protein
MVPLKHRVFNEDKLVCGSIKILLLAIRGTLVASLDFHVPIVVGVKV